jgi:hypothetical protein
MNAREQKIARHPDTGKREEIDVNTENKRKIRKMKIE